MNGSRLQIVNVISGSFLPLNLCFLHDIQCFGIEISKLQTETVNRIVGDINRHFVQKYWQYSILRRSLEMRIPSVSKARHCEVA